MTGRVLVIEDEPDIARAITAVLAVGGLEVLTAGDGEAGLRSFDAGRPDLVLLDIGLPVLDGWAVLDRIRELSDVPVLILTAHGLEAEKVRGLRAGADDYVTKPFSNAELLARVEVLLRRGRLAGEPGSEVYDDGLIKVAFGGREVRVADRPVSLTPIEFRLLAALVRHPNQILSPDQLLAQAWQDPAGVGPDRVKFAVMRLRRKLGPDGADGRIEAVRLPLPPAGERGPVTQPDCYRRHVHRPRRR
jgi:DNA-binding response OmpR family regulator